ncbi:hypothetical protein EVAR_74803_1 [Eumeta japonica]|uniref:Uncharacterized protein n=1 Tax=Eumeta variegata TaxID=151549 RepID=A0A4C1SRT2_EUMVA|nr:hypothetical protein EVAR_74803_1 [Eumeta japonica]
MHDVSSRSIQALRFQYRGSSACVTINGVYTDWLDNHRALDELSVKFFPCVDDQVILVPSASGLQEMVNKMNDSVKKRGTKVNVGVKVMVIEGGESTTGCDILIESQAVIEHPAWTILNDIDCGESAIDRIIGGKIASIGQFPWIARLGYQENSSRQFSY